MALDKQPRNGISACTDDDLEDLRDFQARTYGPKSRQVVPKRAEWLFFDNPHRPAIYPALWIYRRDDEIVATRAFIYFFLKVGDSLCLARWGVDLMADPRVRGTGISYDVGTAARQRGDGVGVRVGCALGLSEDGYRVSTNRGMRDLGVTPFYLWIVDSRRFAQRLARSKIMESIARPLLLSFTFLSRQLCEVRSRGVDLVPIEEFDPRADELWEEASRSYQVIGRRDLGWLRWRFDQGPRRDHYRRYYLMESGRVVGYLVFRSIKWNDQPALAVVDYLAASDHLAALFACATVVARRDGVVVLLCRTLNSSGGLALRTLGYFRRQGGHRLLVRVSDEDPISTAVRDFSAWFLTAADSDLDE